MNMKACPLQELPRLSALSSDLQKHCNITSWNIGVNPVYYRDGHDKMGAHADDTQQEDVILAVLVCSPPMARRIRIEPAVE